jgi:uncharacterized protein (TIGR02271 family)
MSRDDDGRPVEALLVMLAILAAVVIATTADLDAPRAWSLAAVLAGAYILARGASRGDWRAAARRRAAARAPQPRDDALEPPPPAVQPGRPGPEVTLHEDRVHIEHRTRPRERVRVHKHVVTEYVTLSVPVRREELRIERIPLDAPPDPTAEADLTLMEDEPVVETEIVARERVRLSTDFITEEREVSATVRQERAEVEREDIPSDEPEPPTQEM